MAALHGALETDILCSSDNRHLPPVLHFSASNRHKEFVHKSAAKCFGKGQQIQVKAIEEPSCSHWPRQLVRKSAQRSPLPGCRPPLGSHHRLALRKVSSTLLGNLAGTSTHLRVSNSRSSHLRGPTARRETSTSLGPISKYPRREGPTAVKSNQEPRS